MSKALQDFQPKYSCRFHPTDSWHEFGCPHKEWTKEQLQKALNMAKQSNAYLTHCISNPEDLIDANALKTN